MRETITINRIIKCAFVDKEVAQQISAYALTIEEVRHNSEILTKYCSGEHSCKSPDCQFVTGLSGKVYTKAIQTIYDCFDK